MGNGNRDDGGETVTDRQESAAPVADSADPGNKWVDWLLAPCGSPLREINTQKLQIAGDPDVLSIERSNGQRRLAYQSFAWQVEPLDASDSDNFQIVIRDQAGEPLSVGHAERYECGPVLQTESPRSRQMLISKDHVEVTMRWSWSEDGQLITRIEWVSSSGQTVKVEGSLREE